MFCEAQQSCATTVNEKMWRAAGVSVYSSLIATLNCSVLFMQSSVDRIRTRSRAHHCHGGVASASMCQTVWFCFCKFWRQIRRRAKPRRCLLQWPSFGRRWCFGPETLKHRLRWRLLGRRLDWRRFHTHSCFKGLFTQQVSTGTALFPERNGLRRKSERRQV